MRSELFKKGERIWILARKNSVYRAFFGMSNKKMFWGCLWSRESNMLVQAEASYKEVVGNQARNLGCMMRSNMKDLIIQVDLRSGNEGL